MIAKRERSLINMTFWGLMGFTLLYLLVEAQNFPEDITTAHTAIFIFFIGIITITLTKTTYLLDVADVGKELYVLIVSITAQFFFSVLFALSPGSLIPQFSLLSHPLDSLMLFNAQALGEDLTFGSASEWIWRTTKNLLAAIGIPAALFGFSHATSLLNVPLYKGPSVFMANKGLFLSLFCTQAVKSWAIIKTKNVVGSGLGHVLANWIISGAGFAVIKMVLIGGI